MLWDEPKIFFLERRYFFSIILSEFLENRVALHFVIGVRSVMVMKMIAPMATAARTPAPIQTAVRELDLCLG